VSGEEREAQIDDFMRHDSDNFLFLLSTRAAGLGLNLQKANWLVLSTLTGIPRLIDIQAMDRCHRIGQTRPVTFFRFVEVVKGCWRSEGASSQ
jgi:SNF2 family DNA or RNA helicase